MWFRQVHHVDGHLAYVVGHGPAAGVVDPRPSELESYRTLARRMNAQIQWALFTTHALTGGRRLYLPVIQPHATAPRQVLVGGRDVGLQHTEDGPPRGRAYTLGEGPATTAFVVLVDRILLPLGDAHVEVWAHHDPGRIVAVAGDKIFVGTAETPPHLATLPDPWLVFGGAGPLGSVARVAAVRRNTTPRPILG